MSLAFDTEVLVVGAGPSGLTASALLGRAGIGAITVTKYPGTADSPRAHITNQRAVEVFRDLGIEDRVAAQAMPQHLIGTQVYATSFAGKELARMMTWGDGADRRGEYEAASPCGICNISQHDLEPIILASGREHQADIRFSTELIAISQDHQGVNARVRERYSESEYTIRARYAIGADGARSTVVEQLGIAMEGEAGLSNAFTVWIEADLTRYTRHRSGALFIVCRPGADVWFSACACVKPWTEWNMHFLTTGAEPLDMSDEAVVKRVHDSIGDPSVEVRIKKISNWKINHQVANRYRVGRVFIAGDAAHRHPPTNGLGSNTSVQDAYNLVWKLALVLRGKADNSLLDSYDAERRPVGRQVIDRAITSLGQMRPFTDALGLAGGQTEAEGWVVLNELFGDTEQGAIRRKALHEGMVLMDYQFNCHGVELGQRYISGAVVGDGTEPPPYTRDPELHYHPTTFPGAYLPHVWLEREGQRVSTLDLGAYSRFTLIVGVAGNPWIEAARAVSAEFGVPIEARVVGPRQEYDDLLMEWTQRREVGDRGCILVRPDRYVGWRAADVDDVPCNDRLRVVMSRILGKERQ